MSQYDISKRKYRQHKIKILQRNIDIAGCVKNMVAVSSFLYRMAGLQV
jgi:hypothetical protein